MSVTLRPVTRDDVLPLANLHVGADQDTFVAPNAITLAQAAYEKGRSVFGIWNGEMRVGLMAVVDSRESDQVEDGDDPESAFLWRLMIAEEHQRKGLGRAALALFLDWGRARGCPRAATSAVETNAAALAFYESLGFRRTGRMDGNEVILSRDL